MPTPTIRLLSPVDDAHLVPYLAALHAAHIYHDGMVAAFLLPLDNDKFLEYWTKMIEDVRAGTRLIVIYLDESEPGSAAKGAELKGVVMLKMPQAETLIHQGHLEKLMMISTESGSRAARIYAKLDYVEYSRVPGRSITPSGTRVDDVFFYKQLSGNHIVSSIVEFEDMNTRRDSSWLSAPRLLTTTARRGGRGNSAHGGPADEAFERIGLSESLSRACGGNHQAHRGRAALAPRRRHDDQASYLVMGPCQITTRATYSSKLGL
ncbi:hypothetical protein CIB48_g9909 [Xylaria polymorpha]|nr:hypothetical protein CIB48_g9909 [Xylaria polymorpha]